jgi:hypothetical protein
MERKISAEDGYILLNALATSLALDTLLRKLSHTTFFKHSLKNACHRLSKELEPVIDKDVNKLFEVCGEEMNALDENIHSFIANALSTRPEHWQHILFAQEIAKQPNSIFFHQMQAIHIAYDAEKNKTNGSKN